MPVDDGLGSDDVQRLLPVWPESPEGGPEPAISILERRATCGALQYGELLSHSEVLESEGAGGSGEICDEDSDEAEVLRTKA